MLTDSIEGRGGGMEVTPSMIERGKGAGGGSRDNRQSDPDVPLWNSVSGVFCDEDGVVERYVSSGFLLRIFYYLLIFELIAILWVVTCRLFDLRSIFARDSVDRVISPVSLFVGLAYFIVVNYSISGYTTTPKQFLVLQGRVICVATSAFGCIGPSPKPGGHSPESLIRLRDTLLALCYYGFRLFTTDAGYEDPSQMGSVAGVVMSQRTTDSAHWTMHTLLALARVHLGELHRAGLLTLAGVTDATTALQLVASKLEEIRGTVAVRTPLLFRDYVYTVVIVFMVALAPIPILVVAGDVFLLVFYPVIMFLLVGFMIYKQKVGEPFDGSGNVCTLRYDTIVKECRSHVTAACLAARARINKTPL